MRKVIIFTLSMILLFPLSSWTLERSGQIIRELMEQVNQEMTSLEHKILDFDKYREVLLEKLDEQIQSYRKEDNFGKKISYRADVALTLSKMNKRDRDEVRAYLGSIPKLSKVLNQLSLELRQGGKFQTKNKFRVAQKKMRHFMTNTAKILENLNATMPEYSERPEEAKAEIEKLKGHLVGLFLNWDSTLRMKENSLDQVDRTIRDLNHAYTQLVSIYKLLEQERTNLKIINWTTLSQIALIRLSKGKIRNGRPFLESVNKFRRGIGKKGDIIRELMMEPVFSGSSGGGGYERDAQDEAILKKILRGDYD